MQRAITYHKVQSLIAMFVAWFIGYIYFAIKMVHFSGWGYVTDFSAVFFWTGLFAFISSLTFVPLTIKLFNKTLLNRRKYLFPISTMLLSQVALTILLLPFTNFQPFQMGLFYYIYAGIIGLAFGLIYLLFQKIEVFSTKDNKYKKFLVLIFPVLFLLFLFYLFPYTNTTLAYKYFGDSIKDKAIKSVLRKYKVGDKIMDLNVQLPSFGPGAIGNGNMAGTMENFTYDIEYENGIITKLTINDRK